MIVIEPKTEFQFPVEAECIIPRNFSDKSIEEIEDMDVLQGNQKKKLGELFEISEENSEKEVEENIITIRGESGSVKRIGQEMKTGKIIIEGDAGMHTGNRMKGGEIIIEGDAKDYVGENMAGGFMKINGDAGNRLGAAPPGDEVGMKGGTIIVEGNAKIELGRRMRRGLIAVCGDIGEFAGTLMDGGSILSFGSLGERAGAGMERGTIIAFNSPKLLPTFKYSCTYNPTFLRILLQDLEKFDLPIESKHITGKYKRYCGDVASVGKGEILVWKE